MTRALELAGLSAKDVDHINAHGTATPIGDTAEANAIRVARCEHAAVYAPKSALGHSIGAVGALESVLTVLALRDGVIPPTLDYETPDPRRTRRCRGRTPAWRLQVRHQQLIRIRWAQRRASSQVRLGQEVWRSRHGNADHRSGFDVVVTGMAMTTSVATDAESTWKALLDGQSGIRTLTDPFVLQYDLPVHIGGHLVEPPESSSMRA